MSGECHCYSLASIDCADASVDRQFFTKAIALQWPFAFAVMAIVFLASVAVAVPGIMGTTDHTASGRRGERAPLLHEDA